MHRLDQYEYDRLGQLQEQLRNNPLAAERVRRETAALIPDPQPDCRQRSIRVSVHLTANTGGRIVEETHS